LLHTIGFDLGTSGLKAVLVDKSGNVIRASRQSYPLQIPLAGWAEQDPDVWWRALLVTSRKLLVGGPAPDAVGLAGQMHSAVVLGPQQTPLRPAILCNDQRTVRECAEISEPIGGLMATWTGNRIRTVHGDQDPLAPSPPSGSYGSLRAILLPKDFLRLRLTGTLD
jgi:xylulokinase